MLRSKCYVRIVILDLFPHAWGEAEGGRGGFMWEEVVGASLWISLNFHWIWVDFLHVDLHFLTNCARFGSRNYFLG